MTAYPVWHRMLYSCTHMATVGVIGLKFKVDVAPGRGETFTFKILLNWFLMVSN